MQETAVREVEIRTESINLDAFLKWAGLCGTGGEAKTAIQQAEVTVNGIVETHRSRKIVPGDVVGFRGVRLRIKKP